MDIYYEQATEQSQTMDAEVLKTHYPRDNNAKILSFVIQEDPNLLLDLNSISLKFSVEIPNGFLPENGFGCKQFKNMSIELNSQLITSNKSSNELALIDYIILLGNFDVSYMTTGFYSAGHFDQNNVNTSELATAEQLLAGEISRASLRDINSPSEALVTYDFIFRPPCGLLNSKKPLITGTEMTLSFDRAVSDLSLIAKKDVSTSKLLGKAFDLKNVHMTARYYSTPILRNYFSQIQSKSISYYYDEIQVYHKNLPQGETNIRLSNILGGNSPSYVFAGVIESDALVGSKLLSSTCFQRHNVDEFDLTLNGQSLNGFPITSNGGCPLNVYDKFLCTTDRKFMNSCGGMIDPAHFKTSNYLYSHKFNNEISESGWLGINLKLSEAYDTNYVLGNSSY